MCRFDADFLARNRIFFGGGTRIALELGEYRQSDDIDFFCLGGDAYKAARSTVTDSALGELLRPGQSIAIARGAIRADRDAIRCFILPDSPIKLEIIRFDDESLYGEPSNLFPVPVISQESCFTTKLLANADRYNHPTKKDIFDLCMMRREWGEIPEASMQSAADQYGESVIVRGLETALSELINHPQLLIDVGVNSLSIERNLATELVDEVAPLLYAELTLRQSPSPSAC